MTEIQELEPKLGDAYADLNEVMHGIRSVIQHKGAAPELILEHVLKLASDELGLIRLDGRSIAGNVRLAKEIIQNHPGLETHIAAAFESGDYTKLACQNVLQKKAPVEPSDEKKASDERVAKAITSAWGSPFIGNSHELLLDALQNIPRNQHYESITSIVQSSGTGKSRMVNEVRKLVFAIPVNIRKPEDAKSKAYPPSDIPIHRYLVLNNSGDLLDHFARFFDALFTNVLHLLEAQFESEVRQLGHSWKPTKHELAEWWSNVFDETREELYKKVIADASALGADANRPSTACAVHALERLVAAIKERTAASRSKGESPKYPVELLVFFDEAHTLWEVSKGDEKSEDEALAPLVKTRYDHLCTTMNFLQRQDTVYLFMSTASSVAMLTPPAHLARSARIATGRLSFPPPITETPFNCHPTLVNRGERIRAGPDLTMESVRSFDFVVRFGRPLFWSLLQAYRAMRVKAGTPEQDVLTLAQEKLVKGKSGMKSKMAVIDVIHHMDYEPRRIKVNLFESKLVESYMRIAYSVPADRVYMRSGYPSEPILAEAACQQLATWESQNSSFLIDTLNLPNNNGLLSKGECGELTARVLLSAAYRRAVEKEHVLTTGTIQYSRGCQLITFLGELFSEQFIDKILQSCADGRNLGPNLETAFSTGIVRFTHFIKAGDDSSVTAEAAWAAFIRSAAIICKNCQPVIDLIIPVFLCDDAGKTPLCEHAMTGILIQVRDRRRATPTIHSEINALELKYFKPTPRCEHRKRPDRPGKDTQPQIKGPPPYIALIMDLGVQPLARAIKTSKGNRSADAADPPSISVILHNKVQREQPDRAAKAPNAQGKSRYTICVRGCSEKVYKGIRTGEDTSKFAMLLQSRDLFAEHPRDEKWRRAMQNLKPLWTRGSPCYDWVVNDYLNSPAVQEQDIEEEGVDAGDGCYGADPKDDLY